MRGCHRAHSKMKDRDIRTAYFTVTMGRPARSRPRLAATQTCSRPYIDIPPISPALRHLHPSLLDLPHTHSSLYERGNISHFVERVAMHMRHPTETLDSYRRQVQQSVPLRTRRRAYVHPLTDNDRLNFLSTPVHHPQTILFIKITQRQRCATPELSHRLSDNHPGSIAAP